MQLSIDLPRQAAMEHRDSMRTVWRSRQDTYRRVMDSANKQVEKMIESEWNRAMKDLSQTITIKL
jgi:hypothetical protein